MSISMCPQVGSRKSELSLFADGKMAHLNATRALLIYDCSAACCLVMCSLVALADTREDRRIDQHPACPLHQRRHCIAPQRKLQSACGSNAPACKPQATASIPEVVHRCFLCGHVIVIIYLFAVQQQALQGSFAVHLHLVIESSKLVNWAVKCRLYGYWPVNKSAA